MTYADTSWRDHDDRGEMAAVLSVVRRLHEMLAHLGEAARGDATTRLPAARRRPGVWPGPA